MLTQEASGNGLPHVSHWLDPTDECVTDITSGSEYGNFQVFILPYSNFLFLDATSTSIRGSVRPSVRPSVGGSVTPSHFRRYRHAWEHRVASIGSCSFYKISSVILFPFHRSTKRPMDITYGVNL